MNKCACCNRQPIAIGNLCDVCYKNIVRPEFQVGKRRKGKKTK